MLEMTETKLFFPIVGLWKHRHLISLKHNKRNLNLKKHKL